MNERKELKALLAASAGLLLLALSPAAQVGAFQKVSATEGGFGGSLPVSAGFGQALAFLGDLDGDGVGDIAVGAPGLNGSAPGVQALWVLFLEPDGTVKGEQRIAQGVGGFTGPFRTDAGFAYALAALGDLDRDGLVELAVGEVRGGPNQEGAAWILSLRADGTVAREQRIDDADLGGILDPLDWFGGAIAAPGDLDGDGHADLLVGAPFDDHAGTNRGAFYTLQLNGDGSVRTACRTGDAELGGVLVDWDRFGAALAPLDDLDGDGIAELAVGAPGPFFSQPNVGAGAVWILFLGSGGSVRAFQELGARTGGFGGDIEDNDKFGSALCTLDDLDGDGFRELVVGARMEDGPRGAVFVGGVWIVFLGPDGHARDWRHIASGEGGFTPRLDGGDSFGCALAALPDLDRDGFRDLAVGAFGDGDGAPSFLHVGAVWILFLDRGLAPLASAYGCGVNPPGSLAVLAGEPRLGTAFRVGLDNPLGTQASGSRGYLFTALRPDPRFPCGTVVPGLGMAARGSPGEILLDGRALAPGFIVSRQGAPWHGAGSTVDFELRLPLDSALLGRHLYLQGLLVDGSGFGPPRALSEALNLRIGAPASY